MWTEYFLVRVQLDGWERIYKVGNLEVIDMKKKDDYHVAIITCVDGKIEMDFSNSPSLKTMEDDFNIAFYGEVVIGFLDDIKEDIMDRLNSWDNVVGLIDNKPFKASRSLVFEGVDL